jgi:hypothetical protein
VNVPPPYPSPKKERGGRGNMMLPFLTTVCLIFRVSASFVAGEINLGLFHINKKIEDDGTGGEDSLTRNLSEPAFVVLS